MNVIFLTYSYDWLIAGKSPSTATMAPNRNTRDKREPDELERLKKNSQDQLNRLVQEVYETFIKK